MYLKIPHSFYIYLTKSVKIIKKLSIYAKNKIYDLYSNFRNFIWQKFYKPLNK